MTMNHFWLWLLFVANLASTALAGDIVGNGGQIVICGDPVGAEVGTQPDAGIYSLDYIQFRDAYTYQPVSILEDSFDRIEELLALMPTVLQSFKEYRRLIKNENFNTGSRIWTLSDLELIEIKDTVTLRLLPANCRHQNPGDPYGAFQMIVRRAVGEMIFYEAYRPYVQKIEEVPMQASLLYVHEWLWDFAQDAYQSRRANVYMHSLHADADELATLFVRIGLIDAKARMPKAANKRQNQPVATAMSEHEYVKASQHLDYKTALASSPITFRSATGSAAWDDKLIMWGGAAGENEAQNDGAIFDLKTGEWTILNSGPLSHRWNPSSAAWDDKFMVWGGGTYMEYYNNGAIYNLNSGEWTKMNSGPLSPRAISASAAWDDKFIVWGGVSATEFYNNGAIYDLNSGEWTKMNSGPLSPRAISASAVWDNKFMVWGGRDLAEFFNDGAIYDLNTGKWTMMNLGPLSARLGSASAVWDNKFMVWGGRDLAEFFNDGAIYNLNTGEWTKMDAGPLSRRSSPASGVWDGKFGVWGGHNLPEFLGDGAIYDIRSGKWLD